MVESAIFIVVSSCLFGVGAGRWRCRRRCRSALVVLVVTAPPDAGLVAPLGRPIEPVVDPKERVDAACICGIGVVDGAVIERERAHAGSVAVIGRHVDAARGCKPAFRRVAAALFAVAPAEYVAGRRLAPVIVFGAGAL